MLMIKMIMMTVKIKKKMMAMTVMMKKKMMTMAVMIFSTSSLLRRLLSLT